MKILILAASSHSTNILYHHIVKNFEVVKVVIENKNNKKSFIRNRIRKLGIIKVLDQLLYLLILRKILWFFSNGRIKHLLQEYKFVNSEIPESKIIRVDSVNSIDSIELISRYEVDYILLSGTRILSHKLLNSLKCTVLNIHAGITPDYRGVHGAYWAFVNGKKMMAGVTLHQVDKGVDTGQILNQSIIECNAADNIITYPYLQLAEGLKLLDTYFFQFNPSEKNFLGMGESKQYFHPGFFEYFYYRIFRGVK